MRSSRLLSLLLVGALSSASALAKPISFTGADGTRLSADSQGSGSHAVLLLHADGRSRADFDVLHDDLGKASFHSLALDLRGHGESAGTPDEAGYQAMVSDVNQAIAWLQARGAEKVAIVGAELGATVGLIAAAENKAVSNVVMIEPRLTSKGLRISSAMSGYGGRPLLIVVGQSDETGMRAGGAIDGRMTGPHRLDVIGKGDTAREMLDLEPRLASQIMEWIRRDGQNEAAATSKAGELQSGDVSEVETTGTRIGERSR